MAPGTFVPAGQNKLIQHLEGGIVHEVLAREGDLIEAGEPVVRMDETLPNAKLRRLVLRNHRLIAIKARLEAEMSGVSELSVPPPLAAHASDLEIAAIIDRQRFELRARSASRAAEELVLRKEIAGIEESLHGYQAQVHATERQIAIFEEELKDKMQLYKSNLVRKTEVLALRRAATRAARCVRAPRHRSIIKAVAECPLACDRVRLSARYPSDTPRIRR